MIIRSRGGWRCIVMAINYNTLFIIVTNIGCTNVSQAHPLKKDGYLLVFTDKRLCIAKVIAMYQIISGKHSFVTGTIDNIDLLSYILVSLFINIYGDSLFSNECIAGVDYMHI